MHAGFSRTGLFAGVASAALGLAMFATPAQASDINYSFLSLSNQQITNPSALSVAPGAGSPAGSPNVSITAWSIADPAGNATFAPAILGVYNGFGLGVCNATEGANCQSPNHQIDNIGSNEDFVLLYFGGATVSLSSLTVATIDNTDGSNSDDRDVTYWVGNLPSVASLDSDKLSGLGTLGQLSCSGSNAAGVTVSGGPCADDNSGHNTTTFSGINSGMGTYILIGASDISSGDEFKLQGLVVDPMSTPEPGSMLLLGTGLIGAAMRLRRRKV